MVIEWPRGGRREERGGRRWVWMEVRLMALLPLLPFLFCHRSIL